MASCVKRERICGKGVAGETQDQGKGSWQSSNPWPSYKELFALALEEMAAFVAAVVVAVVVVVVDVFSSFP